MAQGEIKNNGVANVWSGGSTHWVRVHERKKLCPGGTVLLSVQPPTAFDTATVLLLQVRYLRGDRLLRFLFAFENTKAVR